MVAGMSRCFCGCGRHVLVRGRVANLYGGNATKLAAEMAAFVEGREEEAPPPDLGWDVAEVTQIRDGLRDCSSIYREVVHREKKLSHVNRLDYVGYRDRAVALLADYRQWLSENPEQLRTAALGQWITDNGFTDEEAAARLANLDQAELERALARYERRVGP
jgi:hypothetical protein